MGNPQEFKSERSKKMSETLRKKKDFAGQVAAAQAKNDKKKKKSGRR